MRENVRDNPGKIRERLRKGLINGFEKAPICRMLRKNYHNVKDKLVTHVIQSSSMLNCSKT